MKIHLETERLLIRPLMVDDAHSLFSIRNQHFVLKYNAMSIKDIIELEEEIRMNPGQYAIIKKAGHQLIGMVEVKEDSLRYGVSSKELSYYLDEKETRKGYMKETLSAIIKYLFFDQDITCITIRIFKENEASHQLVKSLGFHQDGIIRKCVKGYQDVIYDDVIYSILKEEFHH